MDAEYLCDRFGPAEVRSHRPNVYSPEYPYRCDEGSSFFLNRQNRQPLGSGKRSSATDWRLRLHTSRIHWAGRLILRPKFIASVTWYCLHFQKSIQGTALACATTISCTNCILCADPRPLMARTSEVQRSRKLSTSQPLKLLTGWVQIAWHAMSSIPLALPLRCADASKFFASYIAATARSHFFCITPARSCPSVVAASILNELWLNSQHLSFELEPQSRLLQYTTWFIRRRAPPRSNAFRPLHLA